ncbi:hypothetical protein FD754_014850 [Muntiacus muntjak]|uniref:3-oxo-5-alpha-steroid 4-dehydrogenase C-terminal domain-containing protein n=1 Tax=Muntiacus muntjak TaxID=9888 RepID=A0A5N3VLN4_MUNMU|nr:hypothetical protein FD754_014850 [Muntiacus muntjak]
MELAERFLLDALAYLECALGVVCFVLLKLRGSPYGRYASPGSGFGLPARAAWAVQELPSLALPLLACAGAGAPAERLNRWPNCILLAMFLVHYAQRIAIILFIHTWACELCGLVTVTPSNVVSCLGSALWLTGMLVNIHSDHVLRNLRKPGETGYKIPRGGLFEYISAANYFGEVVEWCGYALASWSIQGWAFAVFTFCVLFTRAQQHHNPWGHKELDTTE